MKIKNALWEKRNLSCDVYEIILDEKDLENRDICDEILQNDFEDSYVTVKLPVADLEVLHKLEANGFNFMETQFSLEKSLVKNVIPASLEKNFLNIEIEYISKDKHRWEEIICMISDGLFTTDRMYLDPLLLKNTSSNRYKNWMRDLFENPNAYLAVNKKNDEPYMFGIWVDYPETKEIDHILAGVFETHKDSGLGIGLPISAIKHGLNNGYNKLITSISSNNLPILRLYEYYGYKTQKAEYVLRRKF